MPKLNYQLIARILEMRAITGVPPKAEVISKVFQTKTRHIIPAGWVWK